ncbi:MAG: cytochrome-c peroxidase [Bacteroidetes bacterium]|nr:MAG: cytochrome-c peroxidase [Bacteroidota bacterium]
MRIIFLFLLMITLISCRKDQVHYELTPYQADVPSHFPAMPIPPDNPMSLEGVELGRKLFYDKQLSLDYSISCASCHDQSRAFSDSVAYSKGVNGTLGQRNAMALFNLGWQKSFFWDGRAHTLEEQILEPVPNPIEMHLDWETALQRISSDPFYQQEFKKVFNSESPGKEEVSKAIAQFLRTLISGKSKFDVMYKIANSLSLDASEKVISNQITPQEWAGYDLFKSLNGADCFHCHNGPLMQVQGFSNNGLDQSPPDPGYGFLTGKAEDQGKFKIPSLRNIALTAPYMHDGRFATLDEVIEQYSSGVQNTTLTDPLMEFAHQGGVQLSEEEKQALKAFLHCLTDEQFVKDQRFADPN